MSNFTHLMTMVHQLLPTHKNIHRRWTMNSKQNILDKKETYFYKFNHNIKSEEYKYL